MKLEKRLEAAHDSVEDALRKGAISLPEAVAYTILIAFAGASTRAAGRLRRKATK